MLSPCHLLQVMSLERISIMGKVLAQMSPAMQADNISAAAQWLHNALQSRDLQGWAGEVSVNITAQGSDWQDCYG